LGKVSVGDAARLGVRLTCCRLLDMVNSNSPLVDETKLRPNEAAMAVLSSGRHPARSGLTAVPRIHLLFAPKDGICVYLIMPTSNTACFRTFLNVLSRRFARQDILLVLAGAPNHRCGLVVPDNISLLFLSPYSPELNPKENLGMRSAKNS